MVVKDREVWRTVLGSKEPEMTKRVEQHYVLLEASINGIVCLVFFMIICY